MREKYLDLLEQVLTFSLWPEPPRPPETICWHHKWQAKLLTFVDSLTRRFGVRMCIETPGVKHWRWMAHTLISRERMKNVRFVCDEIIRCGTPGAFVECGVWRGGASIYARHCSPDERKVIICDSFKGFPKHEEYIDKGHQPFLSVSRTEVMENFRKFGNTRNVIAIEGFFCDTLPDLKTQIAILRCDGDLYESTMDILQNLYDQVEFGGFIIIDDFSQDPCRRAVWEFLNSRHLKPTLMHIDENGVYWRKHRDDQK